VGSVRHVFHHVVIKIRQLFYDRPPAWHQLSLKLEWVVTTANVAGTNDLTCLPKHRGAWDNKFWSPILMTGLWERCLATARTTSALIVGRSQKIFSNIFLLAYWFMYLRRYYPCKGCSNLCTKKLWRFSIPNSWPVREDRIWISGILLYTGELYHLCVVG
jgi:hypothetical protein